MGPPRRVVTSHPWHSTPTHLSREPLSLGSSLGVPESWLATTGLDPQRGGLLCKWDVTPPELLIRSQWQKGGNGTIETVSAVFSRDAGPQRSVGRRKNTENEPLLHQRWLVKAPVLVPMGHFTSLVAEVDEIIRKMYLLVTWAAIYFSSVGRMWVCVPRWIHILGEEGPGLLLCTSLHPQDQAKGLTQRNTSMVLK